MTARELADKLEAAIEVDMRLYDDDVPRVTIVGAEVLIAAYTFDVQRKERERRAELEKALPESLRLQSHYAQLLNDWDGGERRTFYSPEEWMARLREVGMLP